MKQFGFLSVISTTGQVIMDVPKLIGTDEFFHFSMTWIGTHAHTHTLKLILASPGLLGALKYRFGSHEINTLFGKKENETPIQKSLSPALTGKQ